MEFLDLNTKVIEDFLEVLLVVLLSKMKDLVDNVLELGGLASVIQGITDYQLFDCKAQGTLYREKGITIIIIKKKCERFII